MINFLYKKEYELWEAELNRKENIINEIKKHIKGCKECQDLSYQFTCNTPNFNFFLRGGCEYINNKIKEYKSLISKYALFTLEHFESEIIKEEIKEDNKKED